MAPLLSDFSSYWLGIWPGLWPYWLKSVILWPINRGSKWGPLNSDRLMVVDSTSVWEGCLSEPTNCQVCDIWRTITKSWWGMSWYLHFSNTQPSPFEKCSAQTFNRSISLNLRGNFNRYLYTCIYIPLHLCIYICELIQIPFNMHSMNVVILNL